jgi:hypothetical protein
LTIIGPRPIVIIAKFGMKSIFATLLIIGALSAMAFAQSVTLAWDASTDPMVTGYHLWWGSLNDQTVPLTMKGVGNATQGTISGLAADTYYAFVTSYNAAGVNSNSSNEVVFTVPNPPAPVTIPIAAQIASPPAGTLKVGNDTWSFGQPEYGNGFPLLLDGIRVDNGAAAGSILFSAPSGVYTMNAQGHWYWWNGQKFVNIPAPGSL